MRLRVVFAGARGASRGDPDAELEELRVHGVELRLRVVCGELRVVRELKGCPCGGGLRADRRVVCAAVGGVCRCVEARRVPTRMRSLTNYACTGWICDCAV